jgi:5'-deoxynucleotidase YfbR-like HD superfamily hydrolase
MKNIVNLLFQANMLKAIPRSGFQFLGVGKESIADHVFSTTFIGWVLAQLVEEADSNKVIAMCLMHDLLEARTGDLNYVQKTYLSADEKSALADTVAGLPFGQTIEALIGEFEEARTAEARLARDADQLALILDLKSLGDLGHRGPEMWIEAVNGRLVTSAGKDMALAILETHKDEWWLQNTIDSSREKK